MPPIPKRTQERHELQPQNYQVNQSSWNRVQQTANNSLASQVKTQTTEPIKNLAQTEQAEQVQEQLDKKRDEGKKWYQKLAKTPQAFKDGYQFGDISQTIGQTTLDIGGSIIGGFESAGQGAGNLIAGLASPFVAQAYSDITGTDYGKTLRAWEKSIGQEHSIYDKYVTPNIRKDSVLGQTSESALEGIGYTLASAGVGQALGTAGEISALGGKLNMPVFSFVTGAGNSLQEGFSKDDYNRAMVWLNAGGEGTIEAFTEGIFGLFGVGGNEITDTLKASVMKKCSTGLGKAIANVGLSGAGEGAEEVLGYLMTFGLHNFEAYAERVLGLGDGSNYAEAFDSEEMWDSFWDSMISTAISMGMAEYSNVDARTAQTLNYCEEQLGRELTDREVRNISREVLKQTESDVEQSLLGEGILNDIQTNEKLSQDQKQFLIEQRQLNLWTDEETKNEINEIIKINENIAKNQQATMQNEAISQKEQQTISNEQKQAQNVTSEDIEQNAKNTLQNNVILEQKGNVKTYKERQAVEIDKNDTLESSYKKYFGDNEGTTYKSLKGIEKVAKDINTKVVFDATGFKNEDGSINTKSEAYFRINNGQREIVVNPYADTGKALERVIGHELTHDVLGTDKKLADQIMSNIEDFWKTKFGVQKYNNMINELKQAYGDNYNREELTAKTMEQLFQTGESLQELANSKPTIFTRIYRSLVGMYAKITGSEKAYVKKMMLDMELAWDKSRNKEKLKEATDRYSRQLADGNEQISLTDFDNSENGQLLIKTNEEISTDKDSKLSNTDSQQDYRDSHQIDIENSKTLNNLNLDEIENKVKKINGALSKQDYSDLAKLKKALQNPENITIYRASPVNELNNGDWVTTDKAYAQNVAKENGGKVYTYQVNANELYYPDNVKDLPSLHRLSSFQYNTQNNQKSELNKKIEKQTKFSVETEEFDRILSENFPDPATTDNNGVVLSEEQKDYFKDSKARDLKTGELVNVYHTTKQYSKQFNEFNPVGTPYYHFGNQIVNYYTDDKKMSGSYAQQKYKPALTKRLKNMQDVQDLLDNYNQSNDNKYTFKIEKIGDTIRLYKDSGVLGEEIADFLEKLSAEEISELSNNIYHEDMLKGTPMEYSIEWNRLNKELQTKYKDFMDVDFGTDRLIEKQAELIRELNSSNEKYFSSEEELYKNLNIALQELDTNMKSTYGTQYSGYVNIKNPFVVNAEGKNWNKIEQLDENVKEDMSRIKKMSDKDKDNVIEFVRNQISDYHKKRDNFETFLNEISKKVLSESRTVLDMLDGEGKFNLDILETDAKFGLISKNRLIDALDIMGIEHDEITNSETAIDLFKMNPEKVLDFIENKTRKMQTIDGEEEMSLSDIAKYRRYLANKQNDRPYDLELGQYLSEKFGIKSYDVAKALYGDIFALSNESNENISKYVFEENNGLATLGRILRNTTRRVQTNDIVKQVMKYNNELFGDIDSEKIEQYGITNPYIYKNRTPEQILAVGGYDGIIIKNVIDYGENPTYAVSPHDLYITFGSEQFKAEDNLDPTGDKDFRYSKDTTGDWENYLTKYSKKGTQTFLPGLKGVMPEKKYSIKDYEDVLNKYNLPESEKQNLLEETKDVVMSRESLKEFEDVVSQFAKDYEDSQKTQQPKADKKEIENNILNTKQTYNTGRKEIYDKYKNDNSKYDKTFINQAKQAIPGNRYGRTKDQWLYVAKTLGNYMANANLTDEQIEKITYRTWLDEAPNQKSNLNRQGEKFVKFNSDDWINAVYNEVNNLRKYSMETEKQEEEIKLPKKTMNPTEISNLKPEDVTTTPNLPEKKYAKGEKTSSFVSNIYNDVEFLNDLQKQDITQDENVRYYKEVTNKKDLENAYKDLQENGQRATLQWYAKNSTDADSEDVAKGWILLKQYADKGDTQNMINVARKLREMGTKAGQTIQAYNIMSRLTPEGMVAYTQSELEDAYKEMIKGKSKAWIDQHKADFDLTPEEVAFIMDTMQNLPAENLETHNYERKVALGQIQKLFTDKLPAEKGKIKAWMRISMLFNPKTQVRNVGGNAIVVPVNMFSDFLGSKVDKLLSKYSGVRTMGNTNLKNYLGGMKEGFYQSYNDYKLGINTRDIEQNRFEFGQGKAFKDTGLGKQINRVDNMLNFVMDFGDRGFYQGSFVNSLNNQMLLNGVDTPTQDMIDIATQEALSRTWNDSNDYTKLVLDIRKALNKIGGENYGLGDVLIPFAKTPANLTKAIVDYSPVGLAKSIMDIKGIKNAIETGQFTAQQQHEFVDHLGKGLAGSLLYVISYALAKAGIASGEPDDDKDLKNFMRYSLGVTPYSITIGNKSFTYDWAQPIATPLAIMSNLMQYEKNNPDASAIEKVLSSVNIGSNQLLEQSFMQSINEVLNGNGEFTDRLAKAVLDLPARAIPTFSKQIADLVDDTQRTTFERGKPVQSAVNAVVAKIPGASKTLTPAVDTLGHDIKKYGGDNNFFNVFFNPANMNKGQESKAGKEIYDVYMKTGDTTVFPEVAPYYIDGSDGRINLDAEKRAKYQRVEGKYAEEAVEKLLNDASYKRLDPTDKAEILSKVVTDSREKAKKDVLNIDKKNSDLNLIEKVGTDYYTYKISTKGMSKDAEQCDVLLNKNYSNKNKQLIYESEINKEDKTYNGLKNIDSNFDMDEYLKYKTQTFSGDNRKEDMVTYINDLNLSRAEQLYIKGRNYKLSNTEKYELESLLEDNPYLEEILDTIK